MNINGIICSTIIAPFCFATSLQAQAVFEDDIQDFDQETGIGCISKEPITKKAEFYFICKSKRSGDAAWNAALYRGKLACKGGNFSVFFNINPTVPTQKGVYGAQAELSCVRQP